MRLEWRLDSTVDNHGLLRYRCITPTRPDPRWETVAVVEDFEAMEQLLTLVGRRAEPAGGEG